MVCNCTDLNLFGEEGLTPVMTLGPAGTHIGASVLLALLCVSPRIGDSGSETVITFLAGQF